MAANGKHRGDARSALVVTIALWAAALGIGVLAVPAGAARSKAALPVRAALCRISAPGPARSPSLLVIGASFTAGVGSGHPDMNWAAQLAERLGWRAVTIGVPGAGFTSRGVGGLGPFFEELALGRRFAARPQVIIVQGGHDDWRVSARTEQRHVAALVSALRALPWRPELVFLSVFSKPGEPPVLRAAQRTTEGAIDRTVRRLAPGSLVIDPFRWHFARRGLHPTAVGYRAIAMRVAASLRAAGVIASADASSGSSASGLLGSTGTKGEVRCNSITGPMDGPDAVPVAP